MPVRCTAKRSHGGRRMHALVGLPHLGGIPCETWDGGMHTARDLVALSVRPPGQILTSWRPLGASHGALTHDCLVHARGLVGPAPLRIVDAPNLPTALTVFDPPFVPAMRNASGAHFLRRKALATFLGGEFEAVASRPWSRPLTWWGMPSRGAARRSCRTRAGGHSGMGSRMRAG